MEQIELLRTYGNNILDWQDKIERALGELHAANGKFLAQAGKMGLLDPDEQRYSNKYLAVNTQLINEIVERAELNTLSIPAHTNTNKDAIKDYGYE